jgi:membrane protease YdiL (CAAX protease family)
LNVIARFIPAVGATWFMGRFVDHRPTSSFVGFRGWQRNLATGILIGGGLLSFLMLGFVVAGTVRLEPAMRDLSLLVITIAVITLAAASEELLFRGYLLQSLATGIGRWPAALIMSGLFGMMHASNPNITNVWWIGIINTVVAGLMLSVAYFKARSLWLPYGIHVAWNAGLGIVLGFSLSGIELDSIWKSSVDSSATLTGGLYGPEGGIICTIVFLAGLFVMGFLPIRSAEARDIKE